MVEMPAKSNPDLLLAQTLAAPFTPRGQGSPLSLRWLPDGGMVVIAADGRKLWFTAVEVSSARAKILQTAKDQAPAPHLHGPVKLVNPVEDNARASSCMPLIASIPEDFLKKK